MIFRGFFKYSCGPQYSWWMDQHIIGAVAFEDSVLFPYYNTLNKGEEQFKASGILNFQVYRSLRPM